LPEFLGNRSPFADPYSRAVVAGMDLDTDIASMERLFWPGFAALPMALPMSSRPSVRTASTAT